MTFNENYEKFDEKFGKTNLLTNMRVAKIYVEQRKVILFHVYFLKKIAKYWQCCRSVKTRNQIYLET